MSLQVFDELEQGTDEWLAARCGIVTASVVGQLITPKTVKPAANDTSRGLTASLVAERITGYTEPTFTSADMERGTLSEPYAREIYGEHYAPVTEVGFMVRDLGEFKLGYSPDGLVGEDGLIEIKAPRQKTHLATILADEVPLEYMAQCQAGLLVSGRKWLDFISYCGGMPLFVKRVLPDERWQEAIELALVIFEGNAMQMIASYEAAVKGRPATERIDFYTDIEVF
ncbi:MAG: lambda exonuclease family protein [Sphingomicrobium sp.]